jgi:trans-aconitate methyltransferase
MSGHRFDDTIDWAAYWEGADEDVRADTSPSADLALDPILEFLDRRVPGGPDAYADVGCGPGDLVFAVADRYPDATAVGYDAAEAVLAENRERARQRGLPNARFEHAVLPDFDPDEEFDVVACLFTLCYVADVEAALRTLYDAVAPGGYLVVHYHNRLAQAHYSRIADAPHEYLDDESAWNPETFAERFRLVVEGESLLSYERIHEVLGTWPRSVFSVAEGADAYGAHRYEPLVFVPN